MIPLDIFRLNLQNKGINNELDAWLAFLSVDEPEIIEQLIKKYPRFKPMYQQIYGKGDGNVFGGIKDTGQKYGAADDR